MLDDLGNKSDTTLCFGGDGMLDSQQTCSLYHVICALSNVDPYSNASCLLKSLSYVQNDPV